MSVEDLLQSSGLAWRGSEREAWTLDGARCVYVHGGHLYASADAAEITTVVGSSVAVCLWDEKARAGGLNHFMLPQTVGSSVASPRFGKFAMERLIELVTGIGGRASWMQASIVGGASVLGGASFRATADLGRRNQEVAREILGHHRINITLEDVGGSHGRKVIFRTRDGLVTVRKVGA